MELQRTVKKMEKAITNLWTELEILKGPKTSLMFRTMSMDTTNQPKIPPDPHENDAADQMLPITKEPKTPADPPEKDAADHMLPISTEKEDIPDPETNLNNQPTTAGSLTAPAAACLEPPQFSLQSGLYQPSTPEAILAVQLAMERCYTQVGTEKEKAILEEKEDQSITTMDEPKWRSPPKDTQN